MAGYLQAFRAVDEQLLIALNGTPYHSSDNIHRAECSVKQHLSTLLASPNLLAFLCRTVLDMMDSKYQLIRNSLSSRKMFFQHIPVLTCYHCFDSFDTLLDFMIAELEIDVPASG